MGSTVRGMRGTAIWTAAGGAALLTVWGSASEAYGASTLVVATDGSDSAPGTLDRPLRTVQRAVDLAKPGDVITVRGGTYALTDNITLTTSGTATQPITLSTYQGERVVVDGERLPAGHAPVGGSIPRAERGAIHMEASYWRISGLELANGPYGVYCDSCSHNVFSRLSTHDNYESGFSGTGNVVRGARLWNNVDDGFDAWKFASPTLIENTIAYKNAAHGVTDNGNPGALVLTRNTTWGNADRRIPAVGPELPRAPERHGRRRPLLSHRTGPRPPGRVSDSPTERTGPDYFREGPFRRPQKATKGS